MPLNWEYRAQDDCFAVEGVAYCDTPCAPALQRLNIYVPASAKGDSTVPVVFYNDIGGYAECEPATITPRNRRFLKDGFVLVSVGARGRQSRDADGRACGKAPAALVDLKAAVRWLRAHEDELLAGNLDRIVSVGTSAGGAMSSLLGLSGNCSAYVPYLQEIGACMDERDDIFAAQCYCPIIDLEHADAAYEWMFDSKRIYTFGPRVAPKVLTDFEQKLSKSLAAKYPAYVNALDLGVTLGEDGRSGSYYTELMECVSQSLNTFLATSATNEAERRSLVAELDPTGAFIEVDESGAPHIRDLDAYVLGYIGRMKGCPAFDPMDGMSPENQEFGDTGSSADDASDRRHFSAVTARIIARNAAGDGDSDGAARARIQAYENDLTDERAYMAGLINPMTFATGKLASDMAQHVRVRLGSRDADHSFSASFNLYRALVQRGVDADYALVWGRGHCDADIPGAFSSWVNRICS